MEDGSPFADLIGELILLSRVTSERALWLKVLSECEAEAPAPRIISLAEKEEILKASSANLRQEWYFGW